MISRSVRCSAKIGIVLVASSLAPRARASGALPADLEVVYSAPKGCPDEHEFEEAIRKRTPGIPTLAGGAPGPKRLEVRLQTTAAGARGRLTAVDRSGSATAREIEAASCAEAADGLALIASLLLDPDSEKALAPSMTPPAPKATERKSEDHAPERRVRVGLVTSFLAASGPSPRIAPGAELSGAVEFEGSGSARLYTRAGIRLSLPTTVSNSEGIATFEWWAGFAAICPGLASGAEVVLAALCVSAEQGILTATGADTRNPRSSGRSWTAIGPGIAIAWAALPPLYVLGTADAIFPLTRDRFVLGNEEIHEVPAVAFRAGIGLGVRAW